MEAGLRGNRAVLLQQFISQGDHTLRPGFEYWITGAANLWIPATSPSDSKIVVNNATANPLTITANGGTPISGVARSTGAALPGGDRVRILPGQQASFVMGDRGWFAQGCEPNIVTLTWTYTGSAQSYTLPSWTGATLEAWIRGAGGAGSDQSIGGGAGACYLRLTLAATTNLAIGQIAAGALLQLIVGRGGQYGGTSPNVFGGGRAGQSTGGQGGDYSGLFLNSVTFANAVAIAGGGGGACGGGTGRNGGGGGGTTGQSGSGSGPGTGGSQSAGGSDGGGQLTGGGANPAGVGGGGGSGYYGGGATTGAGGGGGGSGFLPSGALSGSSLTASTGQSPAALTGAPSDTGTGGNALSSGQNGWIQMVITP